MNYDPAKKALEIEVAWALHNKPSGFHVTKTRRALRERCSAEQNHRCAYCGVRTNEQKTSLDTPTLEHVIPQSKGGRDTYANAVMVCLGCNNKRASRMEDIHLDLWWEIFNG